MIFVTVGTQLPFDRLIQAVDDWAAVHPGEEVVAQIGNSTLQPRHLRHHAFVAAKECEVLVHLATRIVAHAGMGSILTALGLGKPIAVLPRQRSLGEHRSDHQLATARWLVKQPGVFVAWDESELKHWLDEEPAPHVAPTIAPFASEQLLGKLRTFVMKER